MPNIQQIKFENVRDNLEDKILFHRFDSLEELNEKLQEEFDITVDITSTSEENAQECGCDFNLLAGINKDWGYVDIYYLIDNGERLVITEITVSEE